MRYADSYCSVTETHTPEHTYTFIGPCVVTGKEQQVTVKAEDLFRYRGGAYIQDAFPYLDKESREFLITGMSGEGWNLTFGNPDDEDFDLVDEDYQGHA